MTSTNKKRRRVSRGGRARSRKAKLNDSKGPEGRKRRGLFGSGGSQRRLKDVVGVTYKSAESNQYANIFKNVWGFPML